MSVDLDNPQLHWLASTPGVIAPSTPGGRGGFLSDVIVELGFCSREEVEAAERRGRTERKELTAVLVESGTVTSYELARAIAERNGLPYVDLEEFSIDPEAPLLIDRSAAQRYRAVPIGFAPDGALIVALADPLDALAVSDIAVMTKSVLLPVVADAEAIDRLIAGLPEPPARPLPSLAEPAESSEPQAGGEPEPDVAPASAADAWDSAEPAREFEAAQASAPTASREAPQPLAAPESSVPAGVRDRVLAAVESALADLTEGESQRLQDEVERLAAEVKQLRGELEAERQARSELERLRAEDQADRREVKEALAAVGEERDPLAARLDELQQRSEGANRETEALRARLNAAERTAGEAERRAEELQRELAEAERRAHDLEGRADELERRAAEAEQVAQEARVERDRLQSALATVNAALSETLGESGSD